MRTPLVAVALAALLTATVAAPEAGAGTPARHVAAAPERAVGARRAALPAWDVTGYVEDGTGDVAAIDANRGDVTSIGLDTSTITPGGASITAPDTGPVQAAHTIGARAEFLVSNFGASDFSPALGSEVLESAAHRDSVAAAIVRAVARGGWDGVTIDFESLRTRDRADLVTFVRRVRSVLPAGRILTVDVPASADAHDPYIAPYDERALAGAADEVVLMAYDEHYQGGTAGPVAGLPWVEKSLRVALDEGVPRDRLQLGEAGYGYRWYPAAAGATPRSVQVGDAAARALATRDHVAPVWDATQAEWHVRLPDGSVMWWSDRRAMTRDTALATADRLRGTAVWQLVLSDRLPILPHPA